MNDPITIKFQELADVCGFCVRAFMQCTCPANKRRKCRVEYCPVVKKGEKKNGQ